jgi:nucleoside-diphosphate-sugar epimerase
VPSIWKRLQEARTSGDHEIRVGNLDLWRDLGHVEDLVAAVVALLGRGAGRSSRPTEPEVFNVCTGKAKHLEKVAQLLALEAELPDVHFDTDPRLVREGEPRVIVGSCAALTAATGWRPGCQSEEELVKRFLAG